MAASLLVLSGCGEASSPVDSSKQGESTPVATSTSSKSTKTSATSFVPPEEEEAVTLSLNVDAKPVMVTEKIKAYIDAMKAQELTLQYPYRVSPLYGPEDFGSGKPDRDDNYHDYSDAEKGGVDVCEYLNRNDYSGKTENIPVKIAWEKGDLTYARSEVRYWTKADKSDMMSVEGKNVTNLSLANLYRNTKYNYQVILDGAKRYMSQVGEFTTADYPRIMSMGGIPNVRDLGGYMTSYGKRTKQGLIYRGYEIIDESFGQHGSNYDATVEKYNQTYMQIGEEIDLKDSGGRNGRTTSCLQGANYRSLEVVAYDSFLTSSVTLQNLPEIFETLANADQKHVYFHCWGGADRTGMVAFFLNAILGVSYTDLIADFEITTETNNKRCHMHNSSNAHFPNFLGAWTKHATFDPTKTVNENAEAFLTSAAVGISQATIEKIRSIMIEGYSDQLDEAEPVYTYNAAVWEHDNMGHWHPANENPAVKCEYHKHDLVKDAEHSQDADCQHEGHEVYICSGCGQSIAIDTPKGEHNFSSPMLSVANSLGKPVTLAECGGCGEREIAIKYTDGVTYSKGAAQSSVSTKMSNDGTTYTEWRISVDKAIAGAKIYFEGKTDYEGNMSRYFFNQNKSVNPVNPITGEEYPDDTASSPDEADQDQWRYMVQVGEAAKIAPKVGVTFAEAGCGKGPFYLTDIDLAAGENIIRLHAGKIGYRLTFSGSVHIRYHSDAVITGEEITPPDPTQVPAGVYPTFTWSEAIDSENSATLDSGKFRQSSDYIFHVKDVPAAGTYVFSLMMAGNSNGSSYVIGSDGQAFTVLANDVAGTSLINGKSYEEIGLTDANTYVEVAMAEVVLTAGLNTIIIRVGSTGGYRLKANPNGQMKLTAKA